MESGNTPCITLSILIFACIYFCKQKKSYFISTCFGEWQVFENSASTNFLWMANFWKFRVYKFELQGKKNKKKTAESKDIRLMFLPRSSKRKAGKTIVGKKSRHDGKLLLLINSKNSWINQHFLCIFYSCIYFREIWILCIFDAYLFSRMPFKRKFRVYLILQNQPKFAKFAKICTREN